MFPLRSSLASFNSQIEAFGEDLLDVRAVLKANSRDGFLVVAACHLEFELSLLTFFGGRFIFRLLAYFFLACAIYK